MKPCNPVGGHTISNENKPNRFWVWFKSLFSISDYVDHYIYGESSVRFFTKEESKQLAIYLAGKVNKYGRQLAIIQEHHRNRWG